MNRSGGREKGRAEKKGERQIEQVSPPKSETKRQGKNKEKDNKGRWDQGEREGQSLCPREVPASLPSLNVGSCLLSPAPSTAL